MPATIRVINIEHGAESALMVQPSDPVTVFNLLEIGHRSPLSLEGMIDESECFPDCFAPQSRPSDDEIYHPESGRRPEGRW